MNISTNKTMEQIIISWESTVESLFEKEKKHNITRIHTYEYIFVLN